MSDAGCLLACIAVDVVFIALFIHLQWSILLPDDVSRIHVLSESCIVCLVQRPSNFYCDKSCISESILYMLL